MGLPYNILFTGYMLNGAHQKEVLLQKLGGGLCCGEGIIVKMLLMDNFIYYIMCVEESAV